MMVALVVHRSKEGWPSLASLIPHVGATCFLFARKGFVLHRRCRLIGGVVLKRR